MGFIWVVDDDRRPKNKEIIIILLALVMPQEREREICQPAHSTIGNDGEEAKRNAPEELTVSRLFYSYVECHGSMWKL